MPPTYRIRPQGVSSENLVNWNYGDDCVMLMLCLRIACIHVLSVKALPEPSLESSVNCTLLFCLAKKERKYVMAKIQLLAVISIDGCPMKLHPRKRLLQTEDYGMDEIRANALYKQIGRAHV